MAAYTDILVIGKTGRGKSRAGNIILELSPDGRTKVISSDTIEKCQKDGLLYTDLDYFVTESGEQSCTTRLAALANSRTMIRVTDTPGFGDTSKKEGATVFQRNLDYVRDITRLNDVFRYKCVLYFLPFRGRPERADGDFREELEVLYFFFGASIFKRMIVVATNHRDAQSVKLKMPEDEPPFKVHMEFALKEATEREFTECPQILYLSLDDNENHYEFRKSVLEFKPPEENIALVEAVCLKCSGKRKGDRVIYRSKEIELVDSTCHPAFIPRHTTLAKIIGTVLHVVILGIPLIIGSIRGRQIWPCLGINEEKCICCSKAPGTEGCKKFGTSFKTPDGKDYRVKHSNKLDKVQCA